VPELRSKPSPTALPSFAGHVIFLLDQIIRICFARLTVWAPKNCHIAAWGGKL
jgi:hypothetical protein